MIDAGTMNSSSTMAVWSSPGHNSLYEHRLVVAGATVDELDQQHDESSNCNSNIDVSLASASTVDADNSHPYLVRYADMYAHDNSDASSAGTSTSPIFVNVKPPPRFKEGQRVLYTGSGSGSGASEAIITKVHYNDKNQPRYTIKMASGKEEETNSDKLNRNSIVKGAIDENGKVPIKCVDFKTNPTPLFQYLYRSKWKEAQQRLHSHPEEASVWVARYAKKGSAESSNNIRWQLLPLHLYIALGGANNGNNKNVGESEDDMPVDEKDEIERMHEEDVKEGKKPPLPLLDALLSVYPEATQCTDDQNMIPLHSAIRGNSSLSIIETLLEVDPSSVYRKDVRGRNAFILVEKVYGKRIHSVQVGKEDKARERKYVSLMNLLSVAARRVSSPRTRPQPKEKAQGDVQKDQAPMHQEQEVIDTQTHLQQLQNENLALRRENAMLRHRAEMNDHLLDQLVEKLQMYEDQRSVELEFLAERREEILLSISEDDDMNHTAAERSEEELIRMEEKQVGGNGAYHKRLGRYLQTTPMKSDGNVIVISPASTMTEATEPTEPGTPSTSSSPVTYGEDDTNDAPVLKGGGSQTRGVDTENNNSESDESSNNIREAQDIFRPHVPNTRDDNLSEANMPEGTAQHLGTVVSEVDNNTVGESSTAISEAGATTAQNAEIQKNNIASKQTDSVGSENETSHKQNKPFGATGGNDEGSNRLAISSGLSWEEEDQLCVE